MTQEAIDSFGEIMPAHQSALPTLRAAIDPEVSGATFYGSDGENRLEGFPAVMPMNSFATDEEARKKLWEAGEEIAGLIFPCLFRYLFYNIGLVTSLIQKISS